MRSRLWRAVTALYPSAWRRRYYEELSDLCEELATARVASPVRLACEILPRALLERGRSLGRRTLLSGGAAVVVVATVSLSVGFGLASTDRPSTGWLGPHSPSRSRLIRLPAGSAAGTLTVKEPAGYVLLARVTAPRGMRVVVYGTVLLPPPDRFSAVFSTYPLDRDDSCSRAGCTRATRAARRAGWSGARCSPAGGACGS